MDELIQWKALFEVKGEERDAAEKDASPGQQPNTTSDKKVVTNDDEIRRFFETA